MSILVLLLAVAAPADQATPAPHARVGEETVITFAGNGGLRGWQRAGGHDSNALYVRDRSERWYLVTLTGACPFDRDLETIAYTTDINGTFDRFSRVKPSRYPDVSCGIKSIRASAPPNGHQGKRPKA